MNIYTIGFTKKNASRFFELLERTPTRRVIDVRLNNVSQLAGFTKKDDLAFFLKRVAGIDYTYAPLLAPTQSMLDEYKKNGGDWNTYESRFIDLMQKRKIESEISPELVSDGCLLCSEDKAHHCHRRVVAEYFKKHWDNVSISHLG
jgi:uncharacterized protein (DUF488 family)